MGELLDGLVPGLPADARDADLATARTGVPLYAVETVRMLLDRGGRGPGRRRLPGRRARSPGSTFPRRCMR